MQDAGVEIRDARFRMRDKGWGGQDARCGMGGCGGRDAGCGIGGRDTGCEIQDAGWGMGARYGMGDARYGGRDTGVEIRDARFRMRGMRWGGQDARCGMGGRDTGCGIRDGGCETRDAGYGMGGGGCETRILHPASCIPHPVSCISHFRLELTSSSRGWHGVGGRLRGRGHGPWHLWRR